MFLRAIFIAAILAATIIGVASPAHAGSDGSDCPPGYYQAASATACQTQKRDLRIGRPPRSAEMATTRIANTHTQVVRATTTAALHKCWVYRAKPVDQLLEVDGFLVIG